MISIAHRGLSELYPENTLLAFKKAIEAGTDGIETDLRLSLDEEVILFHDDDFVRFTGSDEKPENLSLEELKKIDVGLGESIPTLEEILQLLNKRIILVLEIKYVPSTYKKLCEIIEKKIRDKLDFVEVSCFEDRVLEYIHFLNHNIKLHKLIDRASVLCDEEFDKHYPYVSYFDIEIALRNIALKRGIMQSHKVIFWTVDKEDLSKEKQAGLYGIMKN
ncbi:glycerophosphodiester phosphodiesterase family protein [Sulfurimonas sp.]|jgi:glycerophosphoryl diester phosphodiesterase|uniref:glycerophosphodiester phosphodiesterase n=1 Tax=Sulfurimonas sp. TaxID=2022749 RepID=UPI0025D7A24E|nr:glycerophosphodiester phosphodiesterase family protein [Sulfurimonas sp.]MBT5934449.1 hypothetical protein [Sulfurimonas sp.]